MPIPTPSRSDSASPHRHRVRDATQGAFRLPRLVAVVLLLAAWNPCASRSQDLDQGREGDPGSTTQPILLDMAMTDASLGQVNPDEAIVAFQLYTEAFTEFVGVEATVQAKVFRDVGDLLASGLAGRWKVMGLQVQDYDHIAQHIDLDLMFVPARSGRVTETYVLLVREDSDLSGLEQLENRTLHTYQGPEMGLAGMWLDCLLDESGLPQSRTILHSYEVQRRISSAVLPVLFGKADACLVAQSGLETMIELNPQVAEKLRVVASSPELIPFVVCLRSDFVGENRPPLENAFLVAHEYPQGRQVLTLFGFAQMRQCQESHLASAREIIVRHHLLTEAGRRSRAD